MTISHTRARPIAACLLTGVLASGPANAQGRTWTVDQNGGGDFTDLTPALAAAADGDTIRVLPGTYHGGSTGKALTILGVPGARLITPTGLSVFDPEAIEVVGLPAGRTFVLAGIQAAPLDLALSLGGTFVRVLNCQGTVHLDRVGGDMLQTFRRGLPALVVTNSAPVTVDNSVLRGAPAVIVDRAVVVLADCDVLGQTAFEHPLSGSWPSQSAVDVRNGGLVVGQSRLTGGNGAMRYLGSGTFDASPALTMTAADVLLAATSVCRLAAGGAYGGPISVVTGSGTLHRDGRVALVPYSGAPPLAATVVDHVDTQASTLARGVAPGGTFTLDVVATAGDVAEVYLSLPTIPLLLPWPGAGSLWVDPTAMLVLGRFAVPVTETVHLSFGVPPVPSLAGLAIVVQAITASAARLRASTPATVVLD